LTHIFLNDELKAASWIRITMIPTKPPNKINGGRGLITEVG